jgi:hypothetical protein
MVAIPSAIVMGKPASPVASLPESSDPGYAVFMRAFEGGGAQRDMILLCNALAAKGVRLTILVLRVEGPLRALLDPSIGVIEVPGRPA